MPKCLAGLILVGAVLVSATIRKKTRRLERYLAQPHPCALPLREIQARMAYHGTLVAYCDGTGWKFPCGHQVCRLWAKHLEISAKGKCAIPSKNTAYRKRARKRKNSTNPQHEKRQAMEAENFMIDKRAIEDQFPTDLKRAIGVEIFMAREHASNSENARKSKRAVKAESLRQKQRAKRWKNSKGLERVILVENSTVIERATRFKNSTKGERIFYTLTKEVNA